MENHTNNDNNNSPNDTGPVADSNNNRMLMDTGSAGHQGSMPRPTRRLRARSHRSVVDTFYH
jgi:hypothetical protein